MLQPFRSDGDLDKAICPASLPNLPRPTALPFCLAQRESDDLASLATVEGDDIELYRHYPPITQTPLMDQMQGTKREALQNSL